MENTNVPSTNTAGTNVKSNTLVSENPNFKYELLTPDEKAFVDKIVASVNIHNKDDITTFGGSIMASVERCCDTLLKHAKTNEMGAIGDILTKLVTGIKELSPEPKEKDGIIELIKKNIKKAKKKIEVVKTRFDSAYDNIMKIADKLEDHQITLKSGTKQCENLKNELRESLTNYRFHVIAMVIIKNNIDEELIAAKEKLENSGLEQDLLAYNDLKSIAGLCEKKVVDLQIGMELARQQESQSDIIMEGNEALYAKISMAKSALISTWKSNTTTILITMQQLAAGTYTNDVTDLTSQLLVAGADALKTSMITTANASESLLVSVEALTTANNKIIEGIDEVIRIKDEAHQKRQSAILQLDQNLEARKQAALRKMNA